MSVQITKSDDSCIFEADVIVHADRFPKAVERAENELSREADKLGKVAAVRHYEVINHRNVGQGTDYTIRFGNFD